MDSLLWAEPVAFAQAWARVDGRIPTWRWFAKRVALISLGLFLFFRLVVTIRGTEHPQFGPLLEAIFSVSLGLLFGWVLPYLSRLSPATIWVSNKGIVRDSVTVNNPRRHVCLWEDIDSCLIEFIEIEDQPFRVLTLRLNNGTSMHLGIGDTTKEGQLADLIRGHQKKLTIRLSR